MQLLDFFKSLSEKVHKILLLIQCISNNVCEYDVQTCKKENYGKQTVNQWKHCISVIPCNRLHEWHHISWIFRENFESGPEGRNGKKQTDKKPNKHYHMLEKNISSVLDALLSSKGTAAGGDRMPW